MWTFENSPWMLKNSKTNQVVTKFLQIGERTLEQWIMDYAEYHSDVDFALYLCDDIIDCGPLYVYFQKLVQTGRRRAHESRIIQEMEDQLREQPTQDVSQTHFTFDGGETDNGPV